MNIPDTQIAVQMYNFRDHCTTRVDFTATLAKIRDIGYGAVQMVPLRLDMSIEAVAGLLEENGLYCCSTHDGLTDYSGDYEGIVQAQRSYGCALSFLASPGSTDFYSADGTTALAAQLNQIGGRLKDDGIGFGYHNHHREFEQYASGTMLQQLIDNTDPELVAFEIDVHWIQRGGGSPVKWIKKAADRMPVVHFKDFSIVDGQPIFSEIGEGNLDWEGILAACRETNVRWYVVEQDRPVPGRTIFESARISYENMRSMGLR